ncbi:MAG: cytochrome P450 [Novosphingobium sp.]|nr:cytochrome P450 [Novosphingobium sp.]MCP5403726.1 cytochrome P450 [Novosphingobium sp.]
MSMLDEAVLPVLPVETDEFASNPAPFLEEARKQHPWLARFSQGYFVHGYQATCDLLADDENLHSGFGPVIDFYEARGTMWGRFMDEIIMARPGNSEGHKRLRASINKAFTPRRANDARDMMHQIITRLLDEWAPKGRFDFAEFASYIPISVVCGLLGVSTDEIPRIRSALESQLLSVTLDPAAKPLFMAGWDVMWEFADALVKDREAGGALDEGALLDTLILAEHSGQIDPTELRFMVLTLLFGGYDTTKNQLTMTMKLAVENPEIYERCADDLKYCGKVVEEALRHTPTVSPFRRAARDFTYEGIRFREGDTLVIATPLAGHDPSVFAEAESFDPARANANRHVGFGRGAHICVGQFVAKAILEESLHLIAGRIRHPKIEGRLEWRSILGAYGLNSLPIAFDAG